MNIYIYSLKKNVCTIAEVRWMVDLFREHHPACNVREETISQLATLQAKISSDV